MPLRIVLEPIKPKIKPIASRRLLALFRILGSVFFSLISLFFPFIFFLVKMHVFKQVLDGELYVSIVEFKCLSYFVLSDVADDATD